MMVIALRGVQFGVNSNAGLQNRTTTKRQLPLYCIHFEILHDFMRQKRTGDPVVVRVFTPRQCVSV